jgi:AcrR family transcriptional regulator
MVGLTRRTIMKAERRQQILKAASELFADRGFGAVSIDDIGAAVGVSGPALYRHFSGKEAILAELFVSVSERMYEGAVKEVAASDSAPEALLRLVVFHTSLALKDPELIRVHERDFGNLASSQAKLVRRLLRGYVEVWVEVLQQTDETISAATARTKVNAIFGLLNSTPIAKAREVSTTGRILEQMAMAALMTRATDGVDSTTWAEL